MKEYNEIIQLLEIGDDIIINHSFMHVPFAGETGKILGIDGDNYIILLDNNNTYIVRIKEQITYYRKDDNNE